MGIILSYSIELFGMGLASYESRRYRLHRGHGVRTSWEFGSSFMLGRPPEKPNPMVEIQLRSISQLDRSKGYQLGAYWRISTVGCILYRAMTLTVEFSTSKRYPPEHGYAVLNVRSLPNDILMWFLRRMEAGVANSHG